MKQLVLTTGLLLMAACVFASGSGNGIVGSPHDLSNITDNPWNTREEICRTCHVPHDHQRNIYPTGLLWNHEVTSQVFTPYEYMDGSTAGQPNGVSKLCLGCHDGSVGIDEWDGQNQGGPGTLWIDNYDAGFLVPGVGNAADLRRTHPLSVAYNYDPSDIDGLKDPATAPMGTSGVINDVLPNGQVECSSCHDVHDNESVNATHLLRVSQKATQGPASGLCLACHNK